MNMSRSTKGSKLHPYQLSDDELLAIGRLIRGCAELEDLVDLYLCNLADITEGQSFILLGRSSVSQKVNMASLLATSKGPKAIKVHNECFNNDYYNGAIKCRNTVAHGILLGKTDDDEIAFQVRETMGMEAERLYVVVNTYTSESFTNLARMIEGIIPQVEKHLKLGALREKRRTQALSPHLKAQKTRPPSAKWKPPPQSSEA